MERYGIPFLYEAPLVVYDRGRYRVWHPDFTVPGNERIIVEYAGMPDVPEYRVSLAYKRNVYQANGVKAMFIYPSDLRGAYWTDRVADRILAAAGGYRNFKRYRARSATRPAAFPRRPYARARAYRR